jgi:hypothetical protein
MSEFSHLSDDELREMLYECDDSRKQILRYTRTYCGGVMSKEDKETFLAIDDYALEVFKEIMRRREAASASSSPKTPVANVKTSG